MEKIRVNMTPCEEVKTIHASQNDNSTRKWAFDLYDENGKIDSSSIKEQMIFDSRVGGTEQILPENTSNPTTSPIIADIQYPDSLRSEQTFLYRESPTQEDGQAKITKIKGNTLVWNQLNQDIYQTARCTTNISGHQVTVTENRTSSNNNFVIRSYGFSIPSGHKVYVSLNVKAINMIDFSQVELNFADATTTGAVSETYVINDVGFKNNIFNLTANAGRLVIVFRNTTAKTGTTDNVILENLMIVDLTKMGLDYITSVDQFTSLYQLSYYDYTIGKLLPFKGEELKAVGKNLCNITTVSSGEYNDGVWNVAINSGSVRTAGFDPLVVKKNEVITLSYKAKRPSGSGSLSSPGLRASDNTVLSSAYTRQDAVKPSLSSEYQLYVYVYTVIEDIEIGRITLQLSNASNADFYMKDIQIEYGSSATDFEPYTSSTINLPTLDYFPTGMKDCSQSSQVFDEKTESEAITRVGSADLSTLGWTYYDSTHTWRTTDLSGIAKKPVDNDTKPNFVAENYNVVTASLVASSTNTISFNTNSVMSVNNGSSSTSPTGNLFYELATPTEESITTASLVTEKGEAPLYYDDELIADCNETISSESGIFDAKIKLMADETIYSQKIQLHVERKP